MNFLLPLVVLSASVSLCAAQTVSFESVRLAEVFVESQWASFEPALPTLIAGVQSQLRTAGASETASKTFADELRRSMSKENMTKAVAQALTQNFSEEELRELAVFIRSNLGQKFLQYNKDAMTNPKYFSSILKQACVATTQQLNSTDRSTISWCEKF